jgi:hypothetical protein
MCQTSYDEKIKFNSDFTFFVNTSFSQKNIANQQHAWVTYQGNHKLSAKWGLHTEYQWRRADYFQDWQQSLLRIGLDYHST